MQVWWELHEKYEEELVKLEVFEGDDEEVLDKAGVESPKKQKKSAGKKSKKAKKGRKNSKESQTKKKTSEKQEQGWFDYAKSFLY